MSRPNREDCYQVAAAIYQLLKWIARALPETVEGECLAESLVSNALILEGKLNHAADCLEGNAGNHTR